MNHFTKQFLFALLGASLAMLPVAADARAPVTHRTTKDFRELIVKGERPEIAACMVAAMSLMRTDPKFDAIRWADEDAEAAIVHETENGTHLLRTVSFKAQLRLRNGGFLDTWQAANVACDQRDEGAPEVRVTAIGQ